MKEIKSLEDFIKNPEFEQLIKDHIVSDTTMKEVYGLSDKEMEALYTTAYNMYTHGKYEEAQTHFVNLCQLDQFNKRYWIGLGAARQMLKKYKEAIDAYSFAVMLDDEDPMPSFYAAECFLQLKQKEHMLSALHTVMAIAEGKKEFENIVKQAKARIESATKEG